MSDETTPPLPEAVREQIVKLRKIIEWGGHHRLPIEYAIVLNGTTDMLVQLEAAAQQARARHAQFVTMEPPYCRCPDGACILHPSLSTCGMRSGQIVNFSVDTASHPLPTPEDQQEHTGICRMLFNQRGCTCGADEATAPPTPEDR